MSVLYLACLIISLAAMVLIDRRFHLVFWKNPSRAAIVVTSGVVFFLIWDLCGIALGIFARGSSPFMTGIILAPQLPLEEVFFLTFLCYLTLIVVHGTRAILDTRDVRKHKLP